MRRVVIAVLPFLIAAAPHERVERNEVVVNCANDEWVPTPITAAPGDYLLIEARGECVIGSWVGKAPANGVAFKDTHQLGSEGTLTMKIGDEGGKNVGAHFFDRILGMGGVVKLRVFDKKYEDNKGSISVVITRIPNGLIPQLESERGD